PRPDHHARGGMVMTVVFDTAAVAPDFRRYRAQWESALLSLTLSDYRADARDTDRRDLHRAWFVGLFNGHASHVLEDAADGFRSLEWQQAGPTQIDLIYTAPYGLRCSLGRVYAQPDGSWAALVIAGVRDDPDAAMAAAEWAI